jgi:hypothetical protein
VQLVTAEIGDIRGHVRRNVTGRRVRDQPWTDAQDWYEDELSGLVIKE